MILELLLHPITATKKFFDEISQRTLIAISILIPILLALIPSLLIMQKVNNILKPLLNLGSLFSNELGSTSNKITSNVSSTIFKVVFQRSSWIIIIVTVLTFIILLILNRVRKSNKAPQELWKVQAVSSVQIFYYLILSCILSYLSIYFLFVLLIGVANSIICIYNLINNDEVSLEKNHDNENADVDVAQSPVTNIENIPIKSFKLSNYSKKQKVTAGSILSIILVVLILVFTGNFLTSKERTSEKLSSAIKDNNAKDMAKYIVSSDSRLIIDEESIKAYLAYLKDNPSYTSKLLNAIESQSKGEVSNKLITITKQGKKFLFFDNYVYKLPAYFIKIKTEYKDTEVKINNKVQYTSASDNFSKECGPFLPGKYSLTGSVNTKYATVKGSADLVLNPSNVSSNVFATSLKLEGKKLNLSSKYTEAKILINGKDTEITVGKITSLVPLPVDGSCKVQLEYEFPWGNMKTNEQAIDSKALKLSFSENNSDFMDLIKPSIAEFLNSYVAAYTSLDSSKLTNVTENYKKDLDTKINSQKSSGTPYTGSISSVNGDLSTLNLSYSSTNKHQVIVSLGIKGDFSNTTTPYFGSSKYNLTLNYDEVSKKWIANSFSSSWLSSEIKNGVEIKLK